MAQTNEIQGKNVFYKVNKSQHTHTYTHTYIYIHTFINFWKALNLVQKLHSALEN